MIHIKGEMHLGIWSTIHPFGKPALDLFWRNSLPTVEFPKGSRISERNFIIGVILLYSTGTCMYIYFVFKSNFAETLLAYII